MNMFVRVPSAAITRMLFLLNKLFHIPAIGTHDLVSLLLPKLLHETTPLLHCHALAPLLLLPHYLLQVKARTPLLKLWAKAYFAVGLVEPSATC